MTYTEKELDQFLHGISLSLLSKKSAQHWRYDEETAKEIEWLEALERKVRADKADRKTEPQTLDDGTIVINVDDATKVTRVLVEDGQNGDLYYADKTEPQYILREPTDEEMQAIIECAKDEPYEYEIKALHKDYVEPYVKIEDEPQTETHDIRTDTHECIKTTTGTDCSWK